jgi:phenylalanyl-tRNA synthetase beta chain
LTSTGLEKSWSGGKESLDFFTAKGVVEGLLTKLDISAGFKEDGDKGLCPGRQAAIFVNGQRLGVIGELHPEVSQAFEIPYQVYLFEMDITALLTHGLGVRTFQQIPRFPSVVRDLALVVDNKVSHQQVLDIIKGFPLVKRVSLFDVYSGKQVPAGKKSLAYRLSFQSPEHTLTDEEVDKVQQKILNKLAGKLDASLRD